MILASNIGLEGHPTLRFTRKNGEVMKVWNNNKLGTLILKFLRKKIPNTVDELGEPKKDFLSRLSRRGIRIPLLTGFYKDELDIKNLIVTAGKAIVANLIIGSGSAVAYLALGIGTTAAAAGDTGLESEIVDSGMARAAATTSRVTTTTANDTAQLVKQWTATAAKALTEIGAFDDPSAGNMLGRQVFSEINTENGMTIQMTYKFPVTTA